MKSVKFELMQLAPWAEVHRLLSNAKSLAVKAGGKTYAGDAELVDSLDNGHLVLKVAPLPKPKAKADE